MNDFIARGIVDRKNTMEERMMLCSLIMKRTDIRNILGDRFYDFANKIISGRFGYAYAALLNDVGRMSRENERLSLHYIIFLKEYIRDGFKNEETYLHLFRIENLKQIERKAFAGITCDHFHSIAKHEVEQVKERENLNLVRESNISHYKRKIKKY